MVDNRFFKSILLSKCIMGTCYIDNIFIDNIVIILISFRIS